MRFARMGAARPVGAAFALAGILAGPIVAAAEPAKEPARAAVPAPIAVMSQEALLERQQQRDPSLFLLDLRGAEEFAAGHVPGAVNIPQEQLLTRLAEVPKDRDVVLYCGSGRRSALAADVLVAHGYLRLARLEGDMNGWIAKGRPVESAPGKP